jgi:tetratricopeptide (TPR) repeat protein
LSDAKSEPVGTLATALAHAARLLEASPATAEAQAREILKVVPGQPETLLILAKARRRQEDLPGAIEIFQSLAASQPKRAEPQYELGLALAVAGEVGRAVAALRRAVALEPGHTGAWRALGDALTLAGDNDGAADAYARHIKASVNDPQLIEAAAALCDNRLAVAERSLREFLKNHPTDVSAIRMLAETGARLGRLDDSETLLARCIELAPSFTAARHNYAMILHRQSKAKEALEQADILLREDARNPNYRALKAAILVRLGDYDDAILCYEGFLKEHSRQPGSWMSYGHALKTVGRQEDGIAAYRKSIALQPSLGEAWWSLANLKTFRFTAEDVAAMQAQLALPRLGDEDRFHLHFALGKSLEDAGSYAESFQHYELGNKLRRAGAPYDADETSALTRRSMQTFTPGFFTERAGAGCRAADPIFIVGLPRSGSTLVEQILSSHSTIEGTMELPDILAIARRLGGKKRKASKSDYPEIVATLTQDELRQLGEEYIERARVQRKLGRPFFVDKMPNNFQHIGLIHAILPNARIVDARRHPLGCCLSNFKQHFARGQNFSYGLTDLGRYYHDYVRLMAHYDAVLPGKIHRVIYEDMVDDSENQIRRLLSLCGLPFEDSCLRFYETHRAVRTASSEQVRMPIFTEGVDHWRSYESFLDPLKAALGPVLDAYPAAPSFEVVPSSD